VVEEKVFWADIVQSTTFRCKYRLCNFEVDHIELK